MGVSHILVIFSICFLSRCSGHEYESVRSCYYCNHLEKGMDPKHCHDPVEVKHLIKQNCSDVYKDFHIEPNNHTKFICMKMALKLNGTFMLARECSLEDRGKESSCEFYERYLKNLGHGPVSDVKCSVCHKDLCNDSTTNPVPAVLVLTTTIVKVLFF